MDIDDTHDLGPSNVYGGKFKNAIKAPSKLRNKRIIKANQLEEISRIVTIGGDCKEDNSQPPSIIIEREGDMITKIIVKCACGRHAELSCEEDNEEQ